MKKVLTICSAVILMCGSGQLLAQEQQTVEDQPQSQGIEVMAVQVAGDEGEEGFGEAMIIEATEDMGDGNMRSMRVMSSPGMSFVGDNGMFFGAGSDSFSMLSDPSVRKELELVDEQMDRIREVNAEFGKLIRDSLGDLSKDGFDPDHASKLKETIGEIQRQKQEEIDKLLLPHQIDRLKQVALQMQMQSRGTANALSSDKVAEALGMTQEQVDKLKARSKELTKEIAEKTKQLKADAKQELIGMLSSEQRRKLKEMMGDDFAAQKEDWNDSIQQRMNRRMQRQRGGDQ